MIPKTNSELIEAIKKKEKKKKTNTLITIIILGSLAVFTLMVNVLDYRLNYRENNLIKNGNDQNLIIDSLTNINVASEKIEEEILKYYNRKKYDESSINSMFTDTLERYYLMNNVSKQDAINEDKKYWKKFPNENIQLDSNIITKIDLATGIYTAIARGRYCRDSIKCSDQITIFKFNESFKIFYVRGYYDSKDTRSDNNKMINKLKE
jgi:hypothetical protein